MRLSGLLDGLFVVGNLVGGSGLMIMAAYDGSIAKAIIGCTMYVVSIVLVLRG